MWQRYKANLAGNRAASQDTPAGRKEGLHEARALNRVHDFMARWSSKKAA
jgi:hypothetical protein